MPALDEFWNVITFDLTRKAPSFLSKFLNWPITCAQTDAPRIQISTESLAKTEEVRSDPQAMPSFISCRSLNCCRQTAVCLVSARRNFVKETEQEVLQAAELLMRIYTVDICRRSTGKRYPPLREYQSQPIAPIQLRDRLQRIRLAIICGYNGRQLVMHAAPVLLFLASISRFPLRHRSVRLAAK